MKGNYTKNMLAAIDRASEISKRFGVRYIGSEQVLYGLISNAEGVASKLLLKHGVRLDNYSALLARTFQKSCPIDGFTERCKKMLDRTQYIIEKAGTTCIASEHVLLSILMERDCVAVQILSALGVNLDALKTDTEARVFIGATGAKRKTNVSFVEDAPKQQQPQKTQKAPENA